MPLVCGADVNTSSESRRLAQIPLEESGAGRGNRTLLASLEDWNFTTKLYPRYARNLAGSRDSFKSEFARLSRQFPRDWLSGLRNYDCAGSIPVLRA